MKVNAYISAEKNWRALPFRLPCLFIIAVLFLGQIFAANHIHDVNYAHDHHDEEPAHSSCEYCILASNDDEMHDEATNLNDDSDGSISKESIERLSLNEVKLTSPFLYDRNPRHLKPDRRLRPDAARAPPLTFQI